MTTLILIMLTLVALLTGCATAAKPDGRTVRLVTGREALQGCELLTVVKDDDMKDLKKKAAKEGGDTLLVTGSSGIDLPIISSVQLVAEVYRCGR